MASWKIGKKNTYAVGKLGGGRFFNQETEPCTSHFPTRSRKVRLICPRSISDVEATLFVPKKLDLSSYRTSARLPSCLTCCNQSGCYSNSTVISPQLCASGCIFALLSSLTIRTSHRQASRSSRSVFREEGAGLGGGS